MRFSIRANRSLLLITLLLVITISSTAVAAAVSARNGLVTVNSPKTPLEPEEPTVRAWFPIIKRSGLTPLTPASGPIFGVNFINSAEDLADEQQFANGLSTGAGWNRWPIYWNRVESTQGVFDWTYQDKAIRGDVDHGLKTNAILLGTPGFYTTSSVQTLASEDAASPGTLHLNAVQGAAPVGLYDPVFADGTDNPGPGKQINTINRWANFTFKAVNRYKPGGVLADQFGWSSGIGITHWEMWNEPDLTIFWDSSLEDYARLLKVGYLAAKQADPNAKILFAGLANNSSLPNYYRDVLQIFKQDPQGPKLGFYHDIFATHNYYYSWQSWWYVFQAANTMKSFGFDKPIWLNETGVAAWDDYPGPVWVPDSPYRATMTEQADFLIQSAFYATYAGADAFFHFQLYDGCGNQPYGTDFPPHNGELCTPSGNPLCAGDANGLFSNPTDAGCFTQHPNPESARANLGAIQLLTKHFRNVSPLWRLRPGDSDGNPQTGPQELVAFYRPDTKQRIIGMWARYGDDQTVKLEAKSSQATIIYPDGREEKIAPKNGSYSIHLPGATNQNKPDGWDPTLYPIGGRPRILIEHCTTGC